MRSWSTFRQKSSWNTLQDKPAILTDNQISWSEIQNIPSRILELINFAPNNTLNYSLCFDNGVFLIVRNTSVNLPSTGSIARRDGQNNLLATNYIAASMPISPTGLSAGSFWKDTANENVVKIV